MARDLIHPRTRREFREYCVGWGVLRTIESAFEVEGFEPGPPMDAGGARRSLFETYADAIDWTHPDQVNRAVYVFEEMLSWAIGEPQGAKAVATLKRCLDRDGYAVDEEGKIRPILSRPIRDLPLETLRDSSAIEEHLARLDATGDSDPALAISSSKALIEATCKYVLEELAQPYNDRADVPELVREVQKALKVHPEAISPTKRGRDTIVRTLSNLSQLAIGLAELRNEYGPDHGRTRSSAGLQPRHAHIAIGSAQVFCRFLLETLADRR